MTQQIESAGTLSSFGSEDKPRHLAGSELPTGSTCTDGASTGTSVREGPSRAADRGHLAGLAQHLVDVAGVQLLDGDHLPCELF